MTRILYWVRQEVYLMRNQVAYNLYQEKTGKEGVLRIKCLSLQQKAFDDAINE